VTFLSILTNNSHSTNEQNLLLPSVVAQTQKTSARSAQVKKMGACKKIDGGASEIDGAAHRNCRLAHQSSRPNFFSTETFHQNAEDALNAHSVAVRNACCCVRRRRVQCGAGTEKHAGPTVLTKHRTHNIVPCEKMAAGTFCCIRSL
jgi:hypothetical protein